MNPDLELISTLQEENTKLRARVEWLEKTNFIQLRALLKDKELQLSESESSLKYAKDAIASGWAALGDNLESQAQGGKGIEKHYAHQVQSELRAAGERVSVTLDKLRKRNKEA